MGGMDKVRAQFFFFAYILAQFRKSQYPPVGYQEGSKAS